MALIVQVIVQDLAIQILHHHLDLVQDHQNLSEDVPVQDTDAVQIIKHLKLMFKEVTVS